jgi:hypothetical protein
VANFVIYRDAQHLALPFASALAGQVGAALPELR